MLSICEVQARRFYVQIQLADSRYAYEELEDACKSNNGKMNVCITEYMFRGLVNMEKAHL